jgi:hypothetical protein
MHIMHMPRVNNMTHLGPLWQWSASLVVVVQKLGTALSPPLPGLRPLLLEGWVTQARFVVVTSTASSKDRCLGCGLRKGTQGYTRNLTLTDMHVSVAHIYTPCNERPTHSCLPS